MHQFQKACVSTVAATLLGLASFVAQAVPGPTTTFLFNSFCEDCVTGESDNAKNHPVSATLIMYGDYSNFANGRSSLSSNYFVSFAYGGTNKLSAYQITYAKLISFEAEYYGGNQNISSFDADSKTNTNTVVPFAWNISFADANHYFTAQQVTMGSTYWDTGIITSGDMGNSVNWRNTNIDPVPPTVPEPATMLLLGMGLAGLGLSRRRKV